MSRKGNSKAIKSKSTKGQLSTIELHDEESEEEEKEEKQNKKGKSFLVREVKENIELNEKERIRAALISVLGSSLSDEDLEKYIELFTIDNIDAIYEMLDIVNKEDAYTSILAYIMRIEEQRLEDAKNNVSLIDPPTYKSFIFMNPYLKDYDKIDQSRQDFLLRKPKFVKGVITCPKCKKNYISTTFLQTRSFDEGHTVIYTCGSCGKVF